MIKERFLAIDYGQKRVGIAMTDSSNIIASPYKTVAQKDIIDTLDKCIADYGITTIVLGLPKNLDNTDTDSTGIVKTFLSKIEQRYKTIAIKLVDERYTSKIAKKTIQLTTKKKVREKDKSLVDKVSATLILQAYIESLPNSNKSYII